MTYNQIVARYRGLTKAAKALGISKQTIHSWRRLERIPSHRQIKIEAKSGLKADKTARREAAELVAFLNGR